MIDNLLSNGLVLLSICMFLILGFAYIPCGWNPIMDRGAYIAGILGLAGIIFSLLNVVGKVPDNNDNECEE